MPQPDSASSLSCPSVQLKIVYYGPSGVGKTATLRRLSARLSAASRVLTLDTQGSRTLFFDALPIRFSVGNQPVLLRLVSVPGSAMHRPMRRLLLRGADGVVLVGPDGDSAAIHEPSPAMGERRCAYPEGDDATFDELRSNLRESGMTAASVPVARQDSPWNQPSDAVLLATLRSVLRAAWPAIVRRQASRTADPLPAIDVLDAALLQIFALPDVATTEHASLVSGSQPEGMREAQAVPCGPQSLAVLWSSDARSANRSQAGGASRS